MTLEKKVVSERSVKVMRKPGISPDMVIENGYCIGCGACAALAKPAYEMCETEVGTLVARPVTDVDDERIAAGRVCPFSDAAIDEDSLAHELFGAHAQRHPDIGFFIQTHAARVLTDGFRARGSSGGMGSWLLEQLLLKGLVDGIVHVHARQAGPGEALFEYGISRDIDTLRKGAKSRYYPVTLADVVAQVRREPGRYAFVGVPCFIKALRLLARGDAELRASMAFCIGLVCGHLKSRRFAEFLAWQMGIQPHELEAFDFRHKIEGQGANHYGAEARGRVGGAQVIRRAQMKDLFGQDWGMGLFKPRACDYCDDVVAETADATVGDAWLPRYVSNSEGTNVLILRDLQLCRIVEEGVASGDVWLDALSPEEVVQSQGSGYAHRREGLAYRLAFADQADLWRPLKRVAPKSGVRGAAFEKRHRLRMKLAELSHTAFREARRRNDLGFFFRAVIPVAEAYKDVSRTPVRRIAARIKRLFRPFPRTVKAGVAD